MKELLAHAHGVGAGNFPAIKSGVSLKREVLPFRLRSRRNFPDPEGGSRGRLIGYALPHPAGDDRGVIRGAAQRMPAALRRSDISAFCNSAVNSERSPAITPARLWEVWPMR